MTSGLSWCQSGARFEVYAASEDNPAFLHTRLHLGDDVLTPYKAAIDRWLWPDVFKNQGISMAMAKKTVTDYILASGAAEGLAKLTDFDCERASRFDCKLRRNERGGHGRFDRPRQGQRFFRRPCIEDLTT